MIIKCMWKAVNKFISALEYTKKIRWNALVGMMIFLYVCTLANIVSKEVFNEFTKYTCRDNVISFKALGLVCQLLLIIVYGVYIGMNCVEKMKRYTDGLAIAMIVYISIMYWWTVVICRYIRINWIQFRYTQLETAIKLDFIGYVGLVFLTLELVLYLKDKFDKEEIFIS